MNKLIFTLLFSLCCINSNMHAQNNSDDWEDEDEWKVSVDTCAGNEYIVETSEEVYSVLNKKFLQILKNSTCDIELEGESYKEFEQRRDTVRMQIYRIANELFDFNNIPVSRKEGLSLDMVCFFESSTKSMVGVKFVYDAELKEWFVLEKLQVLEQRLMAANINAGTANLLDNGSPYFEIYLGILTGPLDTGW